MQDTTQAAKSLWQHGMTATPLVLAQTTAMSIPTTLLVKFATSSTEGWS
jgi:hypothetical protein